MKTSYSLQKKTELRERFLRYAEENAQAGRIPTVAECRKALGVSNYMLLNCMNELSKEGIIYRKSRKEGTFLAEGKTASVVGLVLEQGRENEYVNHPSWLAGFCSEFSRNCDFMLRLIQLPPDGDIPSVIRRLGLDALVITTLSRYTRTGAIQEDKLIYSLTGMVENCLVELPGHNILSADNEFWIREYVRAGIRLGKSNFAIISPDDTIAAVMVDEIKQQKLPWHPACHLTDARTLKKKLPEIVKKYNINAVRCAGKYLADFSETVKNMPEFKPFFPYFGSENVYRKMKNDYPWLDCAMIFEHLDDYYERLGKLTAQQTFSLIQSGKKFPSQKIKINYSEKYNSLLNPSKGEHK